MVKFNKNNLSNYLLVLGVISILIYLYMSFGVPITILGFGIFSILTSAIIELNKIKKLKENYYD